MSEVLVEFDTVLRDAAGHEWSPRACTRRADDGLWEGWIEFIPKDEGLDPVRSARETEQTNHDGVMYWAQGLTRVYLEGALRRATAPTPPQKTRASVQAAFDGPAPKRVARPGYPAPHPTLNPFEVYQQGEDVLVSELGALDPARLRDIAVAYELASPETADGATAEALTAMIVSGVRRPSAAPQRIADPRLDSRG